jgi:hypothetical protein
MWDRLRVRWLVACGRLANLIRWPCVIRRCEYSSQLGITVSVRSTNLFTVVVVNGVQVYFYRLTGHIDGVGFTPSSD